MAGLVAAITGPDNLLVTMWLGNVGEIRQFEEMLVRRSPELVVGDRIVHIATLKRIGHLLDRDSRSTEIVPLAVWDLPGVGTRWQSGGSGQVKQPLVTENLENVFQRILDRATDSDLAPVDANQGAASLIKVLLLAGIVGCVAGLVVASLKTGRDQGNQPTAPASKPEEICAAARSSILETHSAG